MGIIKDIVRIILSEAHTNPDQSHKTNYGNDQFVKNNEKTNPRKTSKSNF